MKKISTILLLNILFCFQSIGCGWPPFDEEFDYYNLFMQEIIDDPLYYPFLLDLVHSFHDSKVQIKNQNIEQWQQYLGLSYDDTRYLVFKATEQDVRKLIDGEKPEDENLQFVTAAFVKKHKSSLEYLAYAKYLEPYMQIVHKENEDGWGWSYYSEEDSTADKLNYDEVISTLKSSWKTAKEKEIKLRYGYQLTRFAHYNRKYEEAIGFFDQFVEPLHHKPAIYYYALSQKAGANKGLGNSLEGDYDFLKVFVHSTDLRESVINSFRIKDDTYWDELVDMAQDSDEFNNAYLMLGFMKYNYPMDIVAKIAENTPDAIQAKVLMARAINMLERRFLSFYNFSIYKTEDELLTEAVDKRFPQIDIHSKQYKFFRQTLETALDVLKNPLTKDKNFWNITVSYLYFLDKNFNEAADYLNCVNAMDDKYLLQKKNLDMLIDICRYPEITPQVEEIIYAKYRNMDEYYGVENMELDAPKPHGTYEFVEDVLANRYFLQGEYAKSFLINNDITAIEQNPQLDLLEQMEVFLAKKDKTQQEKYIALKARPGSKISAESYINYIKGTIFLNRGDMGKALIAFEKSETIGLQDISSGVFGMNIAECFECKEENMIYADYADDFPFIDEKMNLSKLTETLIQLEKNGKTNSDQAAKANLLIGNFYYNVTSMGYFRHVLRFDQNNFFCYKYNFFDKVPDIYTQNYFFKYYDNVKYYDDISPLLRSFHYLEKAYRQAEDPELKAHIAFALSKSEQMEYEMIPYNVRTAPYEILVSNRKYFKELMKYQETNFFDEVTTRCKYFEYYVNN